MAGFYYRYGYSATGIAFVLGAFVLQWSTLMDGFLQSTDGHIQFSVITWVFPSTRILTNNKILPVFRVAFVCEAVERLAVAGVLRLGQSLTLCSAYTTTPNVTAPVGVVVFSRKMTQTWIFFELFFLKKIRYSGFLRLLPCRPTLLCVNGNTKSYAHTPASEYCIDWTHGHNFVFCSIFWIIREQNFFFIFEHGCAGPSGHL